MGILDVIKRWFGGGKSAPVNAPPQTRTPSPQPSRPAPVPAAPSAPLSALEALDEIAANRANSKPGAFVERREKTRVNARDGTRVLVIDDSPTIVALLRRMLEQNGYKAQEAVDAETGVVMATSDPPDLIFLDIVLPGMNGFEALRRLRRDPATKSVPIVMISGNELATEQFYAQRIGADDFMKKPFSRSEVFARIEKLLDAEKVPRRHLAVVKPVPAAEGDAPATASPGPIASATPAPALAAVAPTPPTHVPAQDTPSKVAVTPMPIAAVAPPAPAAIVPVVESSAPIAKTDIETVVPTAVSPTEPAALPVHATPDSTPAAVMPDPAVETTVADIGAPETIIEKTAAPAAAEAAVVARTGSTGSPPADEVAPVAMYHRSEAESGPVDVPAEPASAGTVADAMAQEARPAASNPGPTLIIEETLLAPATDLPGQDPIPLAAVASVVTSANSQDSAGVSASVVGTGGSGTIAASASHSPAQMSVQQTAAH